MPAGPASWHHQFMYKLNLPVRVLACAAAERGVTRDWKINVWPESGLHCSMLALYVKYRIEAAGGHRTELSVKRLGPMLQRQQSGRQQP